jgi:hypothetical protein
MAKKWYKSKTLWLNVLPVIAAVLLLATKELTLSQSAVEIVLFAWGCVNIALRALTKEPISL